MQHQTMIRNTPNLFNFRGCLLLYAFHYNYGRTEYSISILFGLNSRLNSVFVFGRMIL